MLRMKALVTGASGFIGSALMRPEDRLQKLLDPESQV